MRICSSDIKDLNLFKHYRIIRKWAAKTSDLKEADIELFFYLEAIGLFTKQDFKDGVDSYSWDNRRWNRLVKEDWIVVWRERNRTTQKYNIYKLSFKGKQLLSRMYRIMLGEEEIPETTRSNKLMKRKSYTDKVLSTAILNVNKDKFKHYANT